MPGFIKKLALLSLIGYLLISFGAISGATSVLAKNPGYIDEKFEVDNFLKLDDQSSYVPSSKKDASNEGEIAAKPAPKGIIAFALNAIDLFIKIIGSIALIIFIAGALLTITSEGKEDKLEKGKSAMIYSLIGLIVALFSFIIVSFVQSIFF